MSNGTLVSPLSLLDRTLAIPELHDAGKELADEQFSEALDICWTFKCDRLHVTGNLSGVRNRQVRRWIFRRMNRRGLSPPGRDRGGPGGLS